MIAIPEGVVSPGFRNCSFDSKFFVTQLEAKNVLQPNAISPAARSGIPRPTTTAGLTFESIDVCSDHIRLSLVSLNVFGGTVPLYRVDHLK